MSETSNNSNILIDSPIVSPHANYRRPSSASSNSIGSGAQLKFPDLPRNWPGSFFLLLHVIFGTVLLIGAVFEFFWTSISLFESMVRPVGGIHPLIALSVATILLGSLILAVISPYKALFGKCSSFRDMCYKTNPLLLYSANLIIIGGIACIGIHIWLAHHGEALTPYLPAGIFLVLHGLMSVRLHYELVNGARNGVSCMMIPYTLPPDEDSEFEAEEMTDMQEEEV